MTKAHIISEIKRTAAANHGAPLGWKRFTNETGIRDVDLKNCLFARYGDACREAGFQPNTLSKAYPDELLLEKLAMLCQTLGRIPSDNDIDIEVRTDTVFPSEGAFRRLGTKPIQVQKLLDYCKGRDTGAHGKVIELAEAYLSSKSTGRQAPEGGNPASSNLGYVYLMKSGRFYKIGKSAAVGRREYELGIQLPEQLTTIHTIRTDDPTGIEAYWHNRFAAKRKNGEWFDLTSDDVVAFRRRKFM